MHATPLQTCKKSFDTLCLASLWSLVAAVLGCIDDDRNVREQASEVAKVGLT